MMLAAVPQSARAAAAPMTLSLGGAVAMALSASGNLGLRQARQALRVAEAQSEESRSFLLPRLDGSLSGQNQELSLQAAGLTASPIPGVNFPASSGSFNTLDARLSATATLLDIGALQKARAAAAATGAAAGRLERLEDVLAARVGELYLEALRADAVVGTAAEDVKRGSVLLELSRRRESAGKATRLDVVRAQARLDDDQERLLGARILGAHDRLLLLRALRLDLGTELELSDDPGLEEPGQAPDFSAVLAKARGARADLREQSDRLRQARLLDSASRWEHFPSLEAYGDYGSIKAGSERPVATHVVGAALRLPLFEGFRLKARDARSLARLKTEEIRAEDLEDQVELELRDALQTRQLSQERLEVAQEGLELSRQELEQARRRYEAGVADNVDVVDAQARLAGAQERRADALFAFEKARLDLWLAMGTIRSMVR